MCVCYFKLWSFRYLRTWFVITSSNFDVRDECCELDVIVNGDRWTYYDLGCMYELWFEILRDFTDYRYYMGLSSMVRLCKWSPLGLISYNLRGSVTDWIHANCCIPSTMHQCLVQWVGDKIEIVPRDSSYVIASAKADTVTEPTKL